MAARRLIPLLDRILVQKVQPMAKSTGGVLLPENALPKVNEGVVIATGPGKRKDDGSLVPVSVKEGDKVLLPPFGGHSVKLDEKSEKETLLYRDDELLGILKD